MDPASLRFACLPFVGPGRRIRAEDIPVQEESSRVGRRAKSLGAEAAGLLVSGVAFAATETGAAA
jgi:hypothetical protein